LSQSIFIANTNRIYRSSARCGFARLIDLRQRRDFVRNGQIDSNEMSLRKNGSADRSSLART